MEEVLQIREKLDKAINDSEYDKILEYLKKANNFKINKDILKSTDIGKSVGKLRAHKDIEISKQSKFLIDKWKKDIEQPATTTSETSTTPSKTTNIKTESVASPSTLKRKSSDTVSTSSSSSSTTYKSEDERPNKKVYEEKKITTTTTKSTSLSSSSGSVSSVSSSTTTTTSTYKCNITPITVGADATARNKIIQMLVESMYTEADDTLSSPEDVAIEIEAELFNIYRGLTGDYKSKVRSFKFNLKSNDELRSKLLNRRITVENFVSMDVMAMAKEELKEERRKLDKFQTEASMIGTNNEATTDQFQCGKCKQRRCTYFQMQTRSADEPMTTFVRCINCGNRWKFC